MVKSCQLPTYYPSVQDCYHSRQVHSVYTNYLEYSYVLRVYAVQPDSASMHAVSKQLWASPEHGEHIVPDKFLSQVVDVDLLYTKLLSSFASRLKFLTLRLSHQCHHYAFLLRAQTLRRNCRGDTRTVQ